MLVPEWVQSGLGGGLVLLLRLVHFDDAVRVFGVLEALALHHLDQQPPSGRKRRVRVRRGEGIVVLNRRGREIVKIDS